MVTIRRLSMSASAASSAFAPDEIAQAGARLRRRSLQEGALFFADTDT
jgi:hypothetical protein